MIDTKKLDKLLLKVEKPARYVGTELNEIIKNKEEIDLRFAFAFPDTYEVGMSHLGMHILYNLLNSQDNIWCERVFAPWLDMEEVLRENNIPLYALESKDELKDFDIIGFTLQYEMSYTNILNMLNLANIPVRSEDRDDSMPLVIAGGPCAFNPEPLYNVIDLFAIGEGEELTLEISNLYAQSKKEGCTKDEFLEKAAQIEGVYVPKFYDVVYNEDGTVKERIVLNPKAPEIVKRRIVKDIDKSYFPDKMIVPYIDTVHDRVVLEILRGCLRGCRFCQAGMLYRPYREKSVDTLLDQADKLIEASGHEEMSLSSLSSSDYSCIGDLTTKLLEKYEQRNIGISMPSLRLDSVGFDLIEKLQEVKKSGLTFAPEAGTQRLRDVINKNLTEEQILKPVKTAFELGWSTVKLYFMLGLPTETMEDVMGIKDLAYKVKDLFFDREREKIKGNLKVTLSAACFVPKPFTPFQWVAQNSIDEFYDKAKKLDRDIKDKKVVFNYHAPRISYMEAVFARGDRKTADALIKAWEKGCKFDGWGECYKHNTWIESFEELGISTDFYATREREITETFPWDFIDIGVEKSFLIDEYKQSLEGSTTPNCREHCSNCGINKRNVGGVCKRV
jgi:radical SAM family uncharacterized protein